MQTGSDGYSGFLQSHHIENMCAGADMDALLHLIRLPYIMQNEVPQNAVCVPASVLSASDMAGDASRGQQSNCVHVCAYM